MSLGTELNNPFDLRDSGIPWRGYLGAKEGFCQFDTIANGLRAGFRDLYTAFLKDGLNTIRKLVSKYAPPSENDTGAYMAGVVKDTGWGEDQIIDLNNPQNLFEIGIAFLRQEQGMCIYSDIQLETAVNEAMT